MFHRHFKVAISVVGCVLLTLGRVVAWSRSVPLPPLLQGIAGDFGGRDGPNAFDHRLKEQYPVGSSEAALVQELSAERFQLAIPPNTVTKTATFLRLGSLTDIARRDAYVSWTVDDKGRLTSIAGHYFVQVS